jgi:hypothetical protein
MRYTLENTKGGRSLSLGDTHHDSHRDLARARHGLVPDVEVEACGSYLYIHREEDAVGEVLVSVNDVVVCFD